MAHSLTRSSTTRVHKMRPILTLNSPLLFAFDGDIFAPGLEIADDSATCSADGGDAGDGAGIGNTTGGAGAAGTGGAGGAGGDVTIDDDEFASDTGLGFATGPFSIFGGTGGLGGAGTGGFGGLATVTSGGGIGGAAGQCNADSGDR
jgi:hypothetical protein